MHWEEKVAIDGMAPHANPGYLIVVLQRERRVE